MNMIIQQKVFNMYRHHGANMLEILEGPVLERQVMSFKEYLEDILWFLSDSTNGNIVMPKCELPYLNSKVLELKNKGLLNEKISIESGTFLIKCIKKDKSDILNLLKFLKEIFSNEIKRDIFYTWDSGSLIFNKELQLKDSVLNTFFDGYVE